MLTGNLNATRFAQKPLYQPTYSFSNVPKAERDLKHSCLQYAESRDDFHMAMGEMLLLCKEAVRRRPDKKGHGGSKPLSLEYLADRFDIDDPLFGYIVRTQEAPPGKTRGGNSNNNWQKGMLQGFVTVTTFTNYQRTFQWNSLHPAAFSFDDDDMMTERLQGERKLDEDGTLAAALQSTVRCGDIWNEGVVWPRIAEISLLGGLGCGATLVKLVIEHLECMRPSSKANYDYVVLQATDNSISFYESMGFVRVGAIVKEENVNQSDSDDEDAVAEPLPKGSPEKADAVAQSTDIISGPLTQYTTKKAGETPNEVAKRLNVDVWDVIFLNKDIYGEIAPTSRLLEGTILHIPVYEKPKLLSQKSKKQRAAESEQSSIPQFYIAKEDDTPREIAKLFNVPCGLLVDANKGRLEGLVSSSRLMAGTRVKVSHLHVPEDDHKPYPHWSFPDDSFDDPEPSYMMAYKLNRKRGNNMRIRPVLESLAVPVSKYEPTDLVMPPSPGPIDYDVSHPPSAADARSSGKSSPIKTKKHGGRKSIIPGVPVRPKRAPCAFLLFTSGAREEKGDEIKGMSGGDAMKYFGDMWNNMSVKERAPYEDRANELREKYFKEKASYEKKLAAFKRDNPDYEESAVDATTTSWASSSNTAAGATAVLSLYNKVVRLKPGAMTEGSEFTYWYVLTYIPDLKWCHLAPMRACGKFGDDKPKSQGRTKYRLVDEKLGKEVDISSSFCIPIKARATKRTLDADMEEWDVIDDGSDPDLEQLPSRPGNSSRGRESFRTSPMKPSAVPKPKPSNGQKKSRSSISSSLATPVSLKSVRLPSLQAVLPKSKTEITVRPVGKGIYDLEFNYPSSHRERGRPKGSNRPKKMAGLSNGQEEVIIEIVSSKKRGRPKGSRNKPKDSATSQPIEARGMAIISSPLTRSQRSKSQDSPMRGSDEPVLEDNEPERKRQRLASPTLRSSRSRCEQKENYEPPAPSSSVKPQSLAFSRSDSAARQNSPRTSVKTKAVSISSQLVTTSSPRRLPKGVVGPSHKRIRHCTVSSPLGSGKRSLRSSMAVEDLRPVLSQQRQSPRLKNTPSESATKKQTRGSLDTNVSSPRLRKRPGMDMNAADVFERPKRSAVPSFPGVDVKSPSGKRRRTS